ncbi:YkoF family thiamine/hydroxymethylpyrimidine-binding protein [Planctobacterium marinum]|uniref:YkoF family thiamine/hydroxymethylpyrimidine-binding protein n=1 Tax=Planctobacterium marinum TaxID=1631968 RepID=UPI001E3E8D22|nr:YkoF family thiamine/hydroxymethylpyrimidine-binding protein [Planctobacterium marinum]MCC2604775.1 thiamine-binding protein [Planctobacterium marinum]
MNISVEVSLYPLADGYLEIIKATVERLAQAQQVMVKTNAMSTQMTGEFDAVMAVLKSEILQTFQETNKAVFVCKFLNSDLEL